MASISHDVVAVYFTEYLSVLFQLTYLDELYGECNGTAHACVNSGYQALFSPITERLGMRLWHNVHTVSGWGSCVHVLTGSDDSLGWTTDITRSSLGTGTKCTQCMVGAPVHVLTGSDD